MISNRSMPNSWIIVSGNNKKNFTKFNSNMYQETKNYNKHDHLKDNKYDQIKDNRYDQPYFSGFPFAGSRIYVCLFDSCLHNLISFKD